MAWEWVAPIAAGASGSVGIFFTWLTGTQGRKQVEAMARREEEKAAQKRVLEERKIAYITALELASIDLRRARYKRDGRQDKLDQVEQKWPKGERVQMSIQITTGIELYGSPTVRRYFQQWCDMWDVKDDVGLDELEKLYETSLAAIRAELGTTALYVIEQNISAL